MATHSLAGYPYLLDTVGGTDTALAVLTASDTVTLAAHDDVEVQTVDTDLYV